MPVFHYRAINPAGKLVKGTQEGDSERQVRSQLRAKQLKPLEVSGSNQKREAHRENASSATSAFSFPSLFKPSLSNKDVALLTRQMASLIQSGMPLVDSLQGVAKQARKNTVKSIVLQIRSRVSEGFSLAKAMAEHPRTFDSTYRAMVNAGEQSGFLGPVMLRLADHAETSQHAKQKLMAAMIYPIVLLLVCVGIVVALMTVVVPKLLTVFERAKTELPGQTQFLIASSNFLRDYGFYCLVAIVVAFLLFKAWLKAPKNVRRWHRILIRIPLIGHCLVQSQTALFASTIAMLIGSGVPLLQALKIASQTLGNVILHEHAQAVANAVQEGSSLHRALDQSGEFPPLLVQMAASGEMNGTLADQLEYAAKNQERELDLQVSTAMNIVEPFTIVFMAAIVGFIMYAILTPIFGMSDLL